MALIRAKEWATKTFAPESRPTALTISKWIANGSINGKIISGQVYVEESDPFPEYKAAPKDIELPPDVEILVKEGIITREDYINSL